MEEENIEDKKIDVILSRKDLYNMLLCYFNSEVESCPLNAEAFCNVFFATFKSNLPPLNGESSLRMSVLLDLFFKQLLTFVEYTEDTKKVPVYKYADFVLFALRERLKEEFPGKLKDR